MSRTLKVTGNHVKFMCVVLHPVREEANIWLPFIFVLCIIKQLLHLVFVISGIVKVSVSVSASADNTYLDLDYSGYPQNLIL